MVSSVSGPGIESWPYGEIIAPEGPKSTKIMVLLGLSRYGLPHQGVAPEKIFLVNMV